MNGMLVDLDIGETMIQSIGVIGAGQMGNGIAQVAACAGPTCEAPSTHKQTLGA